MAARWIRVGGRSARARRVVTATRDDIAWMSGWRVSALSPALVAAALLAGWLAPAAPATPERVPSLLADLGPLTDDTAHVVRGDSVLVPVLANDGDPAGSLVDATLTVATAPGMGRAEVVDSDLDGPLPPQIRYTPNLDAGATDSFDYSVVTAAGSGSATVRIWIANAPPTARDDKVSVTSAPGNVVVADVLANDSDPDGGTLSLASVGPAGLGAITFTTSQVSYDPLDGAAGTEVVEYVVQDGQGGTDTGSLSITVTAPVAPSPSPTAVPPSATAQLPGEVPFFDAVAVPVTLSGASPQGSTARLQVMVDGVWQVVATEPLTGPTATLRWQPTQELTGLSPQSRRSPVSMAVEVALADRTVLTAATGTVTVVAEPSVQVSGPLSRADVPYSYRSGCPVRPAALRRLTVGYWDYSGRLRQGKLIVRTDSVADLSEVFTAAFDSGFPIKRMDAIETFYRKGRRSPTAADKAAMRAGNTSAFNCRTVVGNPFKLSAHAYGVAIDINTFQNPYVTRSAVYPPKSRRYLRRSPCRTGMICRGGVVATTMRDLGWFWGARWSRPDYQHFSSTGG